MLNDFVEYIDYILLGGLTGKKDSMVEASEKGQIMVDLLVIYGQI
jgi:hypothetical protein